MKLFIFITLLTIFSSGLANAIVVGTYFDRIVAIIFENTDYSKAIKNTYLKSLYNSAQGVLLTNYNAITHPSEPNYVAMIYGSTAGITDDGDYNVTGQNIVDRLETNGITWKAYMEDYTCGTCYTGDFCPSGTDLYARKHNPFISMQDINSDPTRCAKIVDASQLDIDINNNQVPQYVMYVPNQNNDGHDTSLSTAMTWFQGWFDARKNNPNFNTNTLFLITWDEGVSKNQVATVLYGSPVKPPSTHQDSTAYTHYSYLATVEKNWNLVNLGRNDATATPLTKYLVHP
ncbi:phosphoesterase family-domain-containing protein [Gigaspora rosea]|uniref:Phosphoesterase family-domain-containing protein n=1 Tax=Gigaspora rosea TaxID=44941 RepID=A0A397UYY1_9GLOM|nr:phosphoesterase family-domain-containing protein [Gigaspora rosea]CAG8446805.1 6602_t:CDS:2 [Gigaspora rosea]